MMSREDVAVRVVVPVGALGAGVSEELVARGIALGADAVAVDAGSTDSGPSCLATGISKYSRGAIQRDLRAIIRPALKAGIPVLVGSCGTSGTDMGVDWTHDIVQEILAQEGLSARVACLYSEQDAATLKDRLARGRISPLDPAEPMTPALIDDCAHIVALMGAEPYVAALRAGADIVLGGRTTDTAVIAAVPLMRGAGEGAAWHAGKIAECGGLCSVNPREGGVMVTVGADWFEVEPLDPANRCTPRTVSAHMLYENANAFRLIEPDGILDVTEARYAALDGRRVRVTGSRHEPKPYTMKLEGAALGPFQTLMLVGIADPMVLAELDGFLAALHARLTYMLSRTYPDAGTFDVSLRPYGWNAVSGLPVEPGYVPREVGLLLVITAQTQALATAMAKACNPVFFHFPLRKGIPLPSYGFPFSPAEIERGQVFSFRLNHVVATDSPMELVRIALHPVPEEVR